MTFKGYRKIKASKLTKSQQSQLRKTIQHDLACAIIRSIKNDPPELAMNEIELVLRPGDIQEQFDMNTANCGTCVTCITCITA